jgi:hypothetical protein
MTILVCHVLRNCGLCGSHSVKVKAEVASMLNEAPYYKAVSGSRHMRPHIILSTGWR